MDILESNKFTMASTPHDCTSQQGKHFWWCDGAGCGQNVYYTDANAMCPEDKCKINTNKPFRHSVSFNSNGSQLTGVTNVLSQEGRTHTFNACNNGDYLSKMGGQLAQMVFVMSLWGNTFNTMSWLDGMTGCSGDCNLESTHASFSDIIINTISSSIQTE